MYKDIENMRHTLLEQFINFGIRAEKINFYEEILRLFYEGGNKSLILMKTSLMLATKNYSIKEKELINLQIMLLDRDFKTYGSFLEENVIATRNILVEDIKSFALEIGELDDDLSNSLLDLINFNSDNLYEFMVIFDKLLNDYENIKKQGYALTFVDIDLIAKSLKNYFERKNGKENLSLS